MMKRREFLTGGTTALLMMSATRARAADVKQFKLGVITDEVTQDLEKALAWAKGYGLEWVEFRNVWGKYITEFTPDEVQRAKDLLAKYGLRVSVLDSAYFKTTLPGTTSKFAEGKGDFAANEHEKQEALLERAFARAKDFGTDKVRIFSFWRVDDPKTVFERIAKELDRTAAIAKREGVRLVLENEFGCNVATGAESAVMLNAVKAPALGLNWDPGNAYAAGELKPFPDGYALLDKKRMWHMHLKDAEGTGTNWRPIGGGKIDYLGQFRAILKDGFTGTMSLETHYLNAAKDKEASSRESMDGLLKVIREV
ncbi:MAG TPA: sugar phosphate isomerase/epimerase family protein [Candidatus Acidoferrum sp.]|nr:sugar phosphate isomerase/epimerase family protein [Candidatus Acidoferrum sp.]